MEGQTLRYQFDTVEVDPAAFVVMRSGQPVELEPKAVRVLLHLIEHRDRTVSKEELMEAVWKDTVVTDNALTRIVAQIRRELGDDARQPRFIQTFHTLGYRFVAADLVVQTADSPLPSPPPRVRRLRLPLTAALFVFILAISAWLLARSGVLDGSRELRPIQLTTSSGLDIGASFSPDGKSFVYSSDRSGRFEIYKRMVGSSIEEAVVTNDGQQNIEPAWSPDGKWIAYHSVTRRGIWVIPVGGRPARQLTDFGSAPAWSPDGKQIVFSAAETVSFAWTDLSGVQGAQPWIWTVVVDGSQLRQVTGPNNPPGQHMMPSWSPDGKDIVFVAVSKDSAIWNLHLSSGKLDLLVQYGRNIPRVELTRWNLLRTPKYGPPGTGLYFCAKSDQSTYAIY